MTRQEFPFKLTEDKFWKVIQRAKRKQSKTYTYDEVVNTLSKALEPLSDIELFEFNHHLIFFRHKAYTIGLRICHYIVMGGGGDDGFMDFREWLISRGKTLYYKALENADVLYKEFPKVKDIPYIEIASMIAINVYTARHLDKESDDFQEAQEAHLKAIKDPESEMLVKQILNGVRIDYDDEEYLASFCPKIFKKWGEDCCF